MLEIPSANRSRSKFLTGFTLVELMITVAILTLVLSGLLAAFIYSLLLNESNNNLVIAANDAQYVLEQIKGVAYSNIESYTPAVFTNLNNENIPAPTVTQTTSNVKEVTINVSWTERQRTRNFQLSTRLAR